MAPSQTNVVPHWIVMNSLFAAILIVGYMHGILDRFLTDDTYITHVIGVVFVMVLLNAFLVAKGIRKDFQGIEACRANYQGARGVGREGDFKESLAEQFSRRLAIQNNASTILVTLGLLGTVVGISLGFSEIDASIVGDAAKSNSAISKLLSGLATALHTTMIGVVAMIWTQFNLHLLKQQTSKLFSAVVWE